MRAIQRVLPYIFCLSFCFCTLFCAAQEESLGEVARRARAAKAAKIAAARNSSGAPQEPGTTSNENARTRTAAEQPADPSKEAFVIESSLTKVAVESDGSATRELAVAIRMTSDAGVKEFAVMRFPFTSADEVVEIDSVQVRKPDGAVVITPESNVQEMPQEVTVNAPTYSDLREKHVAIRGLGVGDLLEARVRFRTVKPQVPGHFWYQYSFARTTITKDERLEISAPSDKYLNVRSPELKPEIHEEGGRRIYRWASTNLQRDQAGVGRQRPGRAALPSVEVSTFRSWDDIGRWVNSLLADRVKVTPPVQAKAAELTQGLKSDETKIQAIYNYVSLRVHYVGVSFGIGRYQPHAGEEVLGNAYGDCKDKHTLLASLLKAAGYDSFPVLINATRDLDPEIPSPGQFDHMITAIPVGNTLMFADSTAEVAPLGLLMPILRDKQALGIRASGVPELLHIPAEPPFASSQSFAVAGKLDANGIFTAQIEQTLRGDMEVLLRAALRRAPQQQWTKLMQAVSYAAGFSGEVSEVHTSEIEDLAQPLRVHYSYKKEKFGDWDTRRIVLPLPIFGIEVNGGTQSKVTDDSAHLGSPQEVVYASQLELPPGYTVLPPRAVHLVRSYAEYHSTNAVHQNVLLSSRRLVVKQRDVPPGEWDGYHRFCQDVVADESTFIKLRIPTVIEADGHGALPTLETNSVPAEDARQAVTYLRAGNAKYSQGDYRGALTDYQNAISLEPGRAIYYHAAGLAEAHLGHHDEAMANYQHAIALDPKFMEPREDLGYEYWLTKQFRKAVDVYRDMLRIDPSFKPGVIRQNLVCALDDSGDHQEARKVEAGLSN